MIDFQELRSRAGPDSLLYALSPTQAESLLGSARTEVFRKGEILFNQGHQGDAAALILSGVIKVSAVAATGREIVFAYLSGGEMVGDIAVLDGAARTASATAAERVECLMIHRSDMQRMISSDPDFASAVIKFLCLRLRSTNALLASDRSYEQAARLARGLLRLLKEHGHRASEAGALGLAISQNDLGAFVSMARENVSRQISDWNRAGILNVEKGRITIVDREALEEIGDIWDEDIDV